MCRRPEYSAAAYSFFVPFEDSFPYYNTDVRGLSRMRMRKKKNLDVRFAACADVMAFEPKEKRRKRRLTWRAYLEVYDEILRQQGDLCFKTDNQRFFEWSLQEICQFGWLIQNISLDLHNSDFEGNVMTEYEEKFSAEGYRIYRLEARRRLPEFLKK